MIFTSRTKQPLVDDQTVQEVVKHRRPKRSEALQVQTEPGDNTRYITNSMMMWDWEKPDMTNNEAVKQRIKDYFSLCASNDMKPSVAGMAFAFGVERKTLWAWVNDVDSKFMPAEVRYTIKKAYSILTIQMEDYMQNGKINPVSGIFLMKNNMGYEDKTDIVVTPNNPVAESAPSDEIANYLIDAGNTAEST